MSAMACSRQSPRRTVVNEERRFLPAFSKSDLADERVGDSYPEGCPVQEDVGCNQLRDQ